MPDTPSATPEVAPEQAPPPRSRRTLWIVVGALVTVLVIGGLVGLVVWSLSRPAQNGMSDEEAWMQLQDAWASAMRKASVAATYPPAPVDVASLQVQGSHTFEAVFTADEITALVTVYRYAPQGTSVALDKVSVSFPAAGEAALAGDAVINGSSYSAELAAPVGYENGSIVARGPVRVSVEGFGVGGERGRQAADAALGYLNDFLDAAPGLTILEAEITAEGLRVSGQAPDSLVNPTPEATPQ